MAYGIIRVRNLHANDIASTEIHNDRLYEENDLKLPDNIQQEMKYGENYCDFIGGDNLQEVIDNKIKNHNIKPRKNSVVALEYILTLSPEIQKSYADNKYDAGGMLHNLEQFIAEKHGWDNVVSISQHFDESNPHSHIIVTPIIEKKVKWKNKNGQGEKIEKRLCAKDYTGGREKLRQLQTDYFEHVKPYGEKLGVEFYRGTKVEHQTRKYTKSTNHEIGQLNQKIILEKDEVLKARLILEREEKREQLLKKEQEIQKEVAKGQDKNKKFKNWKAGYPDFANEGKKNDNRIKPKPSQQGITKSKKRLDKSKIKDPKKGFGPSL